MAPETNDDDSENNAHTDVSNQEVEAYIGGILER